MNFFLHKHFWRMSMTTVLAATLLAGCGGSSSGSSDDDRAELPPNVRQTQQGLIEGVEENYGLAFRGIPFAKPPVGDLRYADPVPAEPWEGTLQANEFGGSCIQPASTFGVAESTEDCLYLNVYSPPGADKAPVMVWIHGGAFETGSGGESYTPSGLLEHGVVVVSLNYRMGVLGFLSHPDLEGPSGSFGIMDQQLALQWVQDNILNFGGDPDNVTIFGESAGGASVLAHISSPAAGDLFHKAIVQSGAYIAVAPQPTQAEIEKVGEDFFGDVGAGSFPGFGCETIECIRALSAEDILAAQGSSGLSYAPTLRADILPLTVNAALASGQYNKVPMIAGSNLDEGRLFVAIAELTRMAEEIAQERPPTGAILTPADYPAEVADLVSTAAAGLIMDAYPLSDYDDNPSIALSAIATDLQFACPSLPQLDLFATSSGYPVYAYEFTDQDAPSIIGNNNSFDLGAAHAFEIQYIFGSRASRQARGMTDEGSLDLADAMTVYWARFASNGDPNNDDGTGVLWPSVQADGNMLELDPEGITTLSVGDFADRHKCAFWSALLAG